MPFYDLIFDNSRNGVARRFVRRLVHLMPDVNVTRRVRHLGPLRFSLRRQHWLMGERNFEGHRRNLAMFQRLTRPGDVFYDVGANIGYYSRFILEHLDVSRLVAFEPMSANIELLRRNLTLGGFDERSEAHQIALSDEAGEVQLQIDDVADGSAVLSRVSGGEPSEGRAAAGLGPKTEMVPAVRLDDFIAERPLPPPNVMKIDTEGAEALVLGGAPATLRDHKPRLIIAIHGPDKLRDVLSILGGAGYVAYGFTPDGYEQLDAATTLADNNIVASADESDVCSTIQPVDLDAFPTPG